MFNRRNRQEGDGGSIERQIQVEAGAFSSGFERSKPAGGSRLRRMRARPGCLRRYAVGGVLFFLIFFMVVRPLMVMLVIRFRSRRRDAGAARVGGTG